MKQLLIKKGRVFIDQSFVNCDIVVDKGIITEVTSSKVITHDRHFYKVIDAEGAYVLPGFMDAHVHFNDPGREEWEGFLTGSHAASAGGISTVFDMPLNSSPSVVTAEILEAKRKHLHGRSLIDFGLWGGITSQNVTDEQILDDMIKSGVVGFKAFLSESGISDFPYLRKDQLKQAMIMTKKRNTTLALHAEDQEYIQRHTSDLLKKRRMDFRAFLESRPEESERIAIEYALEMVKETDASVHFVHVSSPESLELLHQAKKKGFNVSAEVCPHYLLFDEMDFIQAGPILKCAPPLRSRSTVEKLWKCIQKGWVDTIGSDHSPCPLPMKGKSDIWKAWGGIQGVQHGFIFFLNEARKRKIGLNQTLPLLTSNVAKRFGLSEKKGSIQLGSDGDITIYDPSIPWVVTKAHMLTKHPYTPYENMATTGEIITTIVRGEIVYQKNNGISKERNGKEISSSRYTLTK
ncbi:allantoinase AllB [Evansella tamaricis]|uniref:Allantoinase AllB n=1 Tax=Evansella tamaricis TaxID=2069301 RepID=A0ABS6JL41_9BACI|nr:allantoinase AllB [Evansella tamaricis]MBU9713919.1 allantoinase AllB [Evansella tamaricis]